MKTCPACGLVSPGSAEHCGCGYDFASGTTPKRQPLRRAGSGEHRAGVIASWVSFGLAVAASVFCAAAINFSKSTVLTYHGLPSLRAVDPYSALLFLLPVVIALAPILFPRQATRVGSALLLWGFSIIGSASIGLFYIPSAVAMLLAACAG